MIERDHRLQARCLVSLPAHGLMLHFLSFRRFPRGAVVTAGAVLSHLSLSPNSSLPPPLPFPPTMGCAASTLDQPPTKKEEHKYQPTAHAEPEPAVQSGPASSAAPVQATAHASAAVAPAPPSGSLVPAHAHPLLLFRARYGLGTVQYSCDLCGGGEGVGASFSCEACCVDAHPGCFQKAGGDAIVILPEQHHPHALRFFSSRYNGGYGCNMCNTEFTGEAWACDQCGFDACLACAMKDQKVGAPPAAYLEAVATQQQQHRQQQEEQAQAAAAAAARAAAEARINKPPTWPADNVPFPFPSVPFAWNLGSEAAKITNMEGPALNRGADFSLYATHFPAPFSKDPRQFWNGFKRVMLFDLRMLHHWTTGPLIDEAMNAVVWAAIFQTAARAAAGEGEAAWKDLEERGILCAPLESIPSEGNSVFVTHRWSKAGGICSMSPSFFVAYTLFNCGIKGKAPAWVWLDLLSVPQPVPTFSNPHNLTYSVRESELRSLCNASYMEFVGLKFGAIALRCHYFLKHQPLVTIHENYTHPVTGEGGLNKYPLQRAYFAKWGMDESFLQFERVEDAEKAGMTLLGQIKVYTTGSMMNWNALFYTDMVRNRSKSPSQRLQPARLRVFLVSSLCSCCCVSVSCSPT